MRNPKPTTAKRQLNAYHVAQGLQGQARRHAVRSDMKRVRANAECRDIAGLGIGAMFGFCSAPEGIDYWGRRAYPDVYARDLSEPF